MFTNCIPILLTPENSNHLYPSAWYVITGNLNVIPDAGVRNIRLKILNIDFPLRLNSKNVLERSLLL